MSCGTDGRALRPPRNHQPLAIALTHPPPAPFHACRHAGGTVAGVTCHAVRRRAWWGGRAGLRKGDLLLRVDDMLVAPSPQAVNDVVDKIK